MNDSSRPISITISRPIFIVATTTLCIVITSLIIWFQKFQATQRETIARLQLTTEFEQLAAQTRIHADLARTYTLELTNRHQQSLASTKTSQIDPQTPPQLLAKIESELREADRLLKLLNNLEPSSRSLQKIHPSISLLSITQQQTQTALRQSIDSITQDLPRLRTLTDAIQQHHAKLAQQEAEAERIAKEKAAAEKLAAEIAEKNRAAELAEAKARAAKAEKIAKEKSSNLSTNSSPSPSTNAPWRPAPPTRRISTPTTHSTLIVERVVHTPIFSSYYYPYYHTPPCIIKYPHSAHYLCYPAHPHSIFKRHCGRVRGGISIGLSFPIH